MEGLSLEIEEFLKFFVAAVGIFDAFGQFSLRGFDHLFLLADLVGLLLDGILAVYRAGVALVEFLANLTEFFSPSARCWIEASLISSSASFLRFSASRLALSTMRLASVSASLRRK